MLFNSFPETKVNSEILQLDDKIGTLETGKLADVSTWKKSNLLLSLAAFYIIKLSKKEMSSVNEDYYFTS